MFYVLNVAGARSWVLTPEGHETPEAANQAIQWQQEGGDSPSDYRICRLSESGGRFVDIDRMSWAPDRGPYTAEAWERHMRRIGYFEDVSASAAWAALDGLRAAEFFLAGFEDDASQDQGALNKVRDALRALEAGQ